MKKQMVCSYCLLWINGICNEHQIKENILSHKEIIFMETNNKYCNVLEIKYIDYKIQRMKEILQ